jgi:hypothetical protein
MGLFIQGLDQVKQRLQVEFGLVPVPTPAGTFIFPGNVTFVASPYVPPPTARPRSYTYKVTPPQPSTFYHPVVPGTGTGTAIMHKVWVGNIPNIPQSLIQDYLQQWGAL